MNPGDSKDWGHAVSKDLVHWDILPVALHPTPDGHSIWSGSAIIDYKNAAGYQSKDSKNQTMVAFFTGYKGGDQTQMMAYSTDNGVNWKFYDKNPVIPNPKIHDFRDPKVFAYGDHFVIIVTASDHVRLYNSTDLKHWTYMSDFGQGQGSHAGVWECTDLYPINVTLSTGHTARKWILAVNTAGATQYFIGNFDGHKFTNDNPKETVLWLEGGDSYAGVTYNSAPNDRRIFISWMTGMGYVNEIPTNPWKGAMTFPTDIKLVELHDQKLRLAQLPVPEVTKLRSNTFTKVNTKLTANQTLNINTLTKISSKLLDIELTVDMTHFGYPHDRVGIEFAGTKDKLVVYFDRDFVIDRTNAGRHDFSRNFGLVNKAARFSNSNILKLRLILDTSSIELYGDNGLTVMTNMFFSEDNLSSNIKVFYESSAKDKMLHQVNIEELTVRQLTRIWK